MSVSVSASMTPQVGAPLASALVGVIRDQQHKGCVRYEKDILAACKDHKLIGHLGLGWKSMKIESWTADIRQSKFSQLDASLNHFAALVLASGVSIVAALVLLPISMFVPSCIIASLCLGVISVYCFGKSIKSPAMSLMNEIQEQAALDAQIYVALGPIAAMRRKYELGILKAEKRLDLFTPKTKETEDELKAAYEVAFKTGEGHIEDTAAFAKLLQPHQERFEKMTTPDTTGQKPAHLHEDFFREFILGWFQGKKSPGLDQYCEMPINPKAQIQ